MSSLYQEMMGPSIVQQFNEFKQSFTGDPKAELERLVRTGQVSQAQLNAAQQQAQRLAPLLGMVRR